MDGLRLLNSPGSKRLTRGVTLLEVLVAIFVAGVGLLALLVLFPLGALDMAESIRDDRGAAQLHDIADELEAEALQIQAWTTAAQAIYGLAVQQQSVDPKVFDTLLLHLLEIDAALARTREKTRSRIPDLSQHERKIAHKAIFLIDDGRARIRRVRQNLVLIGKLLRAIQLQSDAADR